MTQHTPGPWRAEAEKWPHVRDGNVWWRIYAGGEDDANLVAHCDRTDRDPKAGIVIEVGRTADPKAIDIAQDAANARLIAAAPDLLDACLRSLNYLQRGRANDLQLTRPIDELRAAIAKAMGGTA